MANVRFGLKEVANVIFFDVGTGKPAIFFDTLKVSTIENKSDSAEATGGQGNGRLMSWDFGRTATLTMQDALLSDITISALAGNTMVTSNVAIVGRERKTIDSGTKKISLDQTPDTDSLTIFKMDGNMLGTELVKTTDWTLSSKDVTFTTATGEVMVFYTYTMATGATQITFSGNAFPATYRVVGDTIVRGEDGINHKMQFVIPKAKLKSDFNITMDAGNVATFDFNLDVLLDTATQKLYDIIRY